MRRVASLGTAAVARRATAHAPRLVRRPFSVSAAQQAAAQTMGKPEMAALADQLFPRALREYPNASTAVLDNGLRVASEAAPGKTEPTDLAAVALCLDVGSRYDHKPGVAHFLEHLFFKGTGKRTRDQLEQEIENMGGHLNAYTSREQTVFHANVFRSDVPRMVEIFSDILLNSTIDPRAVEAERSVILREMEEVDKTMEEVIMEKLHYTAYRGSPLSHPILGPEENIRTISREDVMQYLETHYTAPRMALVGAGAVDHQQLVDLGEKHFGAVPRSPVNGIEPVAGDARFTGSDIRIREDDLEVAHIAYAFETCGVTDPDSIALVLLQIMLGNYEKPDPQGRHSSSPLVSTAAFKDLAHTISGFNTQYSDTGLFGAMLSAEAVGQDALMGEVTKEITRFCFEVSPDRLLEAQRGLWAQVVMQYERSGAVGEELGRHILTYGRRMHPHEIFYRIFDLTPHDIKRVANRFFYDRDHALAAIGPIYELPDYNALRNRSHFFKP